MVPPGAAASSALPLNGHRVNPLKVHPSAAVTGQSEAVGVRGGQRRRRREKEKGKGEDTTGASEWEKVRLLPSAPVVMHKE